MALRVRIVAPSLLVGQAVAEALRGRGLSVVGPTAPDRRSRAAPRDVVLLLVDGPATAGGVREVLEWVKSWSGPVLALTESSDVRFDQALVFAGAAGLLPSTASVDEVVEALEQLAEGVELLGAEERKTLEREWSGFVRAIQAGRSRLEMLTPRERVVLQQMETGSPVSVIAARLDLAETTVRSQVKSVLRKLEVRSQLAAVALVRQLESPLATGAIDTPSGRQAEGEGGR